MSHRLASPPRLLGLATLALAVHSQLPAPVAGVAGAPLKSAVDFATVHLHAPVHRLALGLAPEPPAPPAAGAPPTPDALADALDRAHAEIDRLRQAVRELERENDLRQASAADASTRPRVARVTATFDAGPRRVLRLDRGARHGLAAGQTVVHKTTVVGRVVDPVGPATAEVELITAHEGGLQVRVRQRDENDAPTHTVYDNIRARRGPDGETFVAEVARDSPIRRGADVLLADTVHYAPARGRLLGTVEKVTEYAPDPQLLKQLVIRPRVGDLGHALRQVAVLLPVAEEDPPPASP